MVFETTVEEADYPTIRLLSPTSQLNNHQSVVYYFTEFIVPQICFSKQACSCYKLVMFFIVQKIIVYSVKNQIHLTNLTCNSL